MVFEKRSYEERHAQGLDVLDTITGGRGKAESIAENMLAELGPLGSFTVDYALGDIWTRPQLSRRDRSLVMICALGALMADEPELQAQIRGGLNHGLARQEIDELILQISGYSGFPAAMRIARVANAIFKQIDKSERIEREPAASKGDEQRRIDGNDVRQTLSGGRADKDPEQDLENIVGYIGDVGLFASQWAFGELWARDQISRRDRSLAVISILTALSKEDELAIHIPGGLNHGLSREEILEVMVQMMVAGGFPRAVEGHRAAKNAFDKIDARAAKG